MATIEAKPRVDQLLEAALDASRGMRAVAEGKPADFATRSDARSFVGIAGLLDLLVGEVERQRTLARVGADALTRIAELKVRDGAQLVETAQWRKIAGELREIAGEAIAAEPTVRG